MHRSGGGGGMKFEGGRGGHAMGRNGYRRDYRKPEHHGSYGEKDRDGDSERGGGDYPSASVSGLEKRLSAVQKEFSNAMQLVSTKENEKFDLIFDILTKMQTRQADLEESVRMLKAQFTNGGSASGSFAMPQQQQSEWQNGGRGMQGGFAGCSSSSQPYMQMTGQMGGQMGGMGNQCGNQPGMQQFTGQQAMFAAVPQAMVVVSSPGAGMPYGMPQLMQPAASMSPIGPQMAMQFVGQNAAQQNFGAVANAGGGAGVVGHGGGAEKTPGGGGGCATAPQDDFVQQKAADAVVDFATNDGGKAAENRVGAVGQAEAANAAGADDGRRGHGGESDAPEEIAPNFVEMGEDNEGTAGSA